MKRILQACFQKETSFREGGRVCVQNVGYAEKRIQENGQEIVNIYPSMHYSQKPKNYTSQRPFNYKKMPPRPTFSPECLHSSSYFFEDGLRKVHPYYYVYETEVKQIIESMTIRDYLILRLPNKVPRLMSGQHFKNLEPANLKDSVKLGDKLSFVGHYHEHAVLDQQVKKVFENEDILVVNKPSTIPIYPMGGYRFNTLRAIVAKELGNYPTLVNVHRIDKNTSGICILAKNRQALRRYTMFFHTGQTYKEYLAMVEGDFPQGETIVDIPLASNFFSNSTLKNKKEKEAKTLFIKLRYDKETNTSLVKCIPQSGRTHQLRRHLQLSGYPIVNDVNYNPRHIVARAHWLDRKVPEELAKKLPMESVEVDHHQEDWMNNLSKNLGHNVKNCKVCELGKEFTRVLDIETTVEMCLHAYLYKMDGQEFKTEWPLWATDQDHFKKNVYVAK